jgi:hypothetical protein
MEKEKAEWIARDAEQQCLRMDSLTPGWAPLAFQEISANRVSTPQEQVYRACYLYEISKRLTDHMCESCMVFAPMMEHWRIVFPADGSTPPSHAHAILLRCGCTQIRECSPSQRAIRGES